MVDDDPGLLKPLGLRLTSEGYSVVTAESGAEGLRVLNREKVDLVISDLRMDEMDGMQLFAEIQKVQPGMPVIILRAWFYSHAVAATQQGVFSFLTKPSTKTRYIRQLTMRWSNPRQPPMNAGARQLSPAALLMLRLLEQARLVAQSDVSVLINGQSGTGKRFSPRLSTTPARAIANHLLRLTVAHCPSNCWSRSCLVMRVARLLALSAIAKVYSRRRKAERDLDEIGDMPAPLQVKLLRVLQERKARPLGSNRDIDINVRIISATHRDLPKAMARGNSAKTLITASTLSA
ncbi:sigma 54-interacting transcriptional regulator [Escherichia coli]